MNNYLINKKNDRLIDISTNLYLFLAMLNFVFKVHVFAF